MWNLLHALKEVPMSIPDRYQAYAEAFEESYVDDDWSRIEQYFTEDAVYEGEPILLVFHERKRIQRAFLQPLNARPEPHPEPRSDSRSDS